MSARRRKAKQPQNKRTGVVVAVWNQEHVQWPVGPLPVRVLHIPALRPRAAKRIQERVLGVQLIHFNLDEVNENLVKTTSPRLAITYQSHMAARARAVGQQTGVAHAHAFIFRAHGNR